MSYIKRIAIEYLYWLYICACAGWMITNVGELAYRYELILLIPVGLGIIFMFIETGLGKTIIPNMKQDLSVSRLRWYQQVWYWQIILGVIATFLMGWFIVEIQPVKFFTQFRNASGILSGIFNPNTRDLVPMLRALVETIYLALMSTVFAIPFAFMLSFFAAKNLMYHSIPGRIVYVLIRTISTVFRSIEAIVWAIIFCVWVGIGPFAGMLALWIHSIASLIKLYSEQIESIDPGPVEAITATGASTLQIWRYAVAPQIIAPYFAFTIYRWDINVRMATIVGFVGGGGIGLALQQQQQMLAWRSVGLIMWLIAIVVWVMDMLSGYLREKLLV